MHKKLKIRINKDGFRKDLKDYFSKYMFTYKKQISPFIVVGGDFIFKATHTKQLINLEEDITIFHTWPGKWKSDVFVFTIKEMNQWIKDTNFNTLKMM